MASPWVISGTAALRQDGNVLTDTTHPFLLRNVMMQTDGVLQMRPAFTAETVAGGVLVGTSKWIGRHVANDGTEEGWAASTNAGTAMLARRQSLTWGTVSFSDTAVAADLDKMHSATQNGKLFLAYNSDVNRLHVWDGTSVRRVGLIKATAPTANQMGVGAVSFTRLYRQRNTVQVSGVTTMRSEASTTVSITIVNRLGVTVTKGAVSGENETHWELEAADAAAGPWYRIATTVVGTTTFDDTAATISTTDLSPTDGLYVPPPSAKYLLSDGGVLLMAGAWETSAATGQTTPAQNRVWFTRPLGSSNVSDDESITQTADLLNYIDIGDMGPIVGMAGPIYGDIYIFKSNCIWKLVPTGDLDAPYAKVQISDSIGAVGQRLITQGHYNGAACVYFCSQKHVWVLSAGALMPMSDPMEYLLPTRNGFETFTCLVFDSSMEQVLAFTSVDTGLYYAYHFDVRRKRWGYSEIADEAITRGVMLTDGSSPRLYTAGGRSTSSTAVLYFGRHVGLDFGTAYDCIADYGKPFGLEIRKRVTLQAPTIWYRCPVGAAGPAITLTISYVDRDTGLGSDSVTKVLTNSEVDYSISSVNAMQVATLEGLTLGDVGNAQVRISVKRTSGATADTHRPPIIFAISVPYIEGAPYPA